MVHQRSRGLVIPTIPADELVHRSAGDLVRWRRRRRDILIGRRRVGRGVVGVDIGERRWGDAGGGGVLAPLEELVVGELRPGVGGVVGHGLVHHGGRSRGGSLARDPLGRHLVDLASGAVRLCCRVEKWGGGKDRDVVEISWLFCRIKCHSSRDYDEQSTCVDQGAKTTRKRVRNRKGISKKTRGRTVVSFVTRICRDPARGGQEMSAFGGAEGRRW